MMQIKNQEEYTKVKTSQKERKKKQRNGGVDFVGEQIFPLFARIESSNMDDSFQMI